jgi:hypothetical protein
MLLNFSHSRTGLGLLILRGTAAVGLLIESLYRTTGRLSSLSVVIMVLAILIGLGYFTSVSAALAGSLIVALIFVSRSEPITSSGLAALCAAVALLRAGAYSVDGLFHGRRRITMPKT